MIAFVGHRVYRTSALFNNAFSLFAKYQRYPRTCVRTHVDHAYRQISARLIRVVLREGWKTSEPQSIKS